MILSQACQYGIQAVFYLALQKDEPVLSRDMASRLSIPPHYLAKILQDLSRHGLLLSHKGRGGGFKLARPPGKIKLLDIVLATEGTDFGQKCLLGLAECSGEVPCPVHAHWAPIKEAFWNLLSEKSVQELIEDAAALRPWLLPGVPVPRVISWD